MLFRNSLIIFVFLALHTERSLAGEGGSHTEATALPKNYSSPLAAAKSFCSNVAPDRAEATSYFRTLDLTEESFSIMSQKALLKQPIFASQRTLCINTLLPGAIKANIETGVPASFLVAQAALESGWCRSTLAQKAYNFSGMKAEDRFGNPDIGLVGHFTYWPISYGRTKSEQVEKSSFMQNSNEAKSGVKMQTSRFMKFRSPAEGIYSAAQRLLHPSRPYKAKCLALKNDTTAFTKCVGAIWAQDGSYAKKLLAMQSELEKELRGCDVGSHPNVSSHAIDLSTAKGLTHYVETASFDSASLGAFPKSAFDTKWSNSKPQGKNSLYQTRADWGALPPQADLTPLNPEAVNKIILHHTVGAQDQNMTAIQSAHFQRTYQDSSGKVDNWSDLGYNYVIGKDPSSGQWKIYEGRGKYQGAHAGAANASSIGVSIMGNYESDGDEFTPGATSQRLPKEAIDLLGALTERLKIDYPNISGFQGHTHHMATLCPGSNCLPVIDAMNKRNNWVRKKYR